MDENELKMEELDSVSGGSAAHPENDTGEDTMTQCGKRREEPKYTCAIWTPSE